MNPLFSIVIPLYNHERFIAEAINSVLQQSVQSFELIIVDDGSTDKSADIVAKFDDPRISYFHQENQGAHVALNYGFKLSRGTFVAVLNSDDIYYPERLEHALCIFNQDEQVNAYFSSYDFVDESSKIIRCADDIIDLFQIDSLQLDCNDDFWSSSDKWVLFLLSGNVFHTTSNLVLRRSLFYEVGGFRNWRYVHDYDFFLRLCSKTNIFFDEKPLLKYRFHGSNTLSENSAMSVLETNLVIAEFLLNWRPVNIKALPQQKIIEIFKNFYTNLRLYGGERLLLALILSELMVSNQAMSDIKVLNILEHEAVINESIIPALTESIKQDTRKKNLEWQEKQTQRWWSQSQQLEADLAWQKSQADQWWQKSQQLEADLAWQKSQADQWWQKSQQLETDLAWQKSQTDQWWQKSQHLEADLIRQQDEMEGLWQNAQAAAEAISQANRLYGIPNVITHFRQKFMSRVRRAG